MSLGRPDLYIGGQLMQSLKDDPRPALAGLRLGWGTDSRLEMDPPSKLSGQILVRGAMPSWLDVGAPVGLVDPVTARTLFAGMLGPLQAVPDDSVRGALRVTFNATSPLAELAKHKVLDVNYDANTPAAIRWNTLASELPRGWALTGSNGYTWVNQTKQQYKVIEWLTLAERYCRSYLYRYHDTSYYVQGAGLFKRLTFSPERGKSIGSPGLPGTGGAWFPTGSTSAVPQGASGIALLPNGVVGEVIEWEKSPEDMITDVQLSSFQAIEMDTDKDSTEFEYRMNLAPINVDNSALQDAYGFRQVKIQSSLSTYNATALGEQARAIVNYWLDTSSKWRPTGLQLPDSRRLATDPLLNLLAVDTRVTATVKVPYANTVPGVIQSFVMGGQATWTGKKWITDLTLGRTL